MQTNYESNPILERLPKHLRQFIKPQNYKEYTPINQAVWRYVMRKNVDYLSRVAHESYLEGLKKTGLEIDKIPDMYGMNRILKDIGWAAVAVDGFIPPIAFMEFQAYHVLVIASDIRQLENIEYTPAPDIIHEGAGHAPIIANKEYSEYLRRFGEIGSKAISSAHDYEIYEAIRELSILKEAEGTPLEQIEQVESLVNELQNKKIEPSEMALIRNLHWWTVEYGLIGSMDNPKIYGAGLLSSIGESAWCMRQEVKKIPYDINAAYQGFDITKPQPQLYVTPNFAYLSLVLEEFANTMAIRTGGMSGLNKLIASKALGTVELSTGIQISGIFSRVIEYDGKPIYMHTSSPTALAYHDRELINHGTDYHSHGFGSPIGKLKGINLSIEDMSPKDLQAYNIEEGKDIKLEFEGNITVEGRIITGRRNIKGKIILISLENCTVRHEKEVLFQPEWGIYDMVIGKKVTSCYAGPADYSSFDLIAHVSQTKTIKQHKSPEKIELENLYLAVRSYREKTDLDIDLAKVLHQVNSAYPADWLLTLEIAELAHLAGNSALFEQCKNKLHDLQLAKPAIAHLIKDGLELIVN